MTEPPTESFECKQIFVAHQTIWDQMLKWANDRGFYLQRIPDGSDDEGRLVYKDDEDTTPTSAFMPKETPR
jgi:DNA primase